MRTWLYVYIYFYFSIYCWRSGSHFGFSLIIFKAIFHRNCCTFLFRVIVTDAFQSIRLDACLLDLFICGVAEIRLHHGKVGKSIRCHANMIQIRNSFTFVPTFAREAKLISLCCFSFSTPNEQRKPLAGASVAERQIKTATTSSCAQFVQIANCRGSPHVCFDSTKLSACFGVSSMRSCRPCIPPTSKPKKSKKS